jgi:hypothetical protein
MPMPMPMPILAQSFPLVQPMILQAGSLILVNGGGFCLSANSSGYQVIVQPGNLLPSAYVTTSNSIVTIPAGSIVLLQNGTPICLQSAAMGFQVVLQ